MPLHCFPSAQHATKTAVCSVSGHKSLYFLHFSNCRYSSPSRVFYEGTNSESHAPLWGGRTWGRDYVYHPQSHVVGYLCTKNSSIPYMAILCTFIYIYGMFYHQHMAWNEASHISWPLCLPVFNPFHYAT